MKITFPNGTVIEGTSEELAPYLPHPATLQYDRKPIISYAENQQGLCRYCTNTQCQTRDENRLSCIGFVNANDGSINER